MAPNLRQQLSSLTVTDIDHEDQRIRCALLGCGMMGQEHISYIMGYSRDIRIDFLCDPYEGSLQKAQTIMQEFAAQGDPMTPSHTAPLLLQDEQDLLKYADAIDLLVIASPNYLHTPTLLKWGQHDLTILVEKPVAVSQKQHDELLKASQQWKARVWVAMEYRYIPAIAKLLSLIPEIGDLKMVTIRENRYPFLHKIGKWNRDREKTGDTLVEKCCHFFDLFRLITGQEAVLPKVRALAQRGLNYQDEDSEYETPIIDSAYVTMPFRTNEGAPDKQWSSTIGCLELCMFSEGSRHQEEIIVTGTKGRLEAYLPENKVYFFERPCHEKWKDRSIPPPPESIRRHVFDCSNVREVHSIDNEIPTHGGYHYSSTAIEWYHLLQEIKRYRETGEFQAHVSCLDGLRAVQMGIEATAKLVNELEDES
ncbi:oxidoreductase [Nitzschia inconspicua]|uniref:Oxidoreductase n=1 Tax=Nitzschia inconspicua TaxID=303405 RepID=A0A9K3LM09_9STRA|nr:oxidoreductase [Nitzschia inconspicua]